jgi:hypothetical protein
MDNAERVKVFLAERKGRFFCNRCLGETLYIHNSAQLNQATRPLRGVKPYRNGKVICHSCGQDRECIAHG